MQLQSSCRILAFELNDFTRTAAQKATNQASYFNPWKIWSLNLKIIPLTVKGLKSKSNLECVLSGVTPFIELICLHSMISSER